MAVICAAIQVSYKFRLHAKVRLPTQSVSHRGITPAERGYIMELVTLDHYIYAGTYRQPPPMHVQHRNPNQPTRAMPSA